MRTLIAVALVLPTLVLPAPARADCAAIERALAGVAGDVHCVASADLTTRNADTTPPDNSRPGLPPNAFTPRTDAQAVSPDAPFRTPIDPDRTFPGLQVTGAMTDDANARWVLRLPTNWNGRLVVGVPGGLRSAFMGDFIFSDLVAQLAYAYVSTNTSILIDLPVALRNWEPYVASGFSRQSAAFQAMLGAGYPPDILARPPTPGNTFSPVVGSHWETHANNYWDVTTCVFVRELDPLYPMNQLDPLGGSDTKDYNYLARRKAFQLSPRLGQISTDGDISRPLITLQGTMDALLPIKRHGRPFRDAVVAAGRAALHRYYEIQNGNHIERYRQSCCNFTQLEFVQPHAHRAFQLLVDWVERGAAPPPSQCVPRGGTIVANPGVAGQPERCAALLAE